MPGNDAFLLGDFPRYKQRLLMTRFWKYRGRNMELRDSTFFREERFSAEMRIFQRI